MRLVHLLVPALLTLQAWAAVNIQPKPTAIAVSGKSGLSTGANAVSQGSGGVDPESKPESASPFFMSVSMIVVSEIGDKTFLIAALMAMKAPRLLVFTAAFSSLAIMTVLSGIVGHALPSLIPQNVTQMLASLMFVVFGVRLFKEGLHMSKEVGVGEEMQEVEDEMSSADLQKNLSSMENGGSAQSQSSWKAALTKVNNLMSYILSPIWVQVFVMTFLGEWGDRSQIATIAMAAGSDYWSVILGAVLGHAICTAAAVIGGKLMAQKISMRNVTLGGAVTFIIFAILYLYDALNTS